ncbi:MAG: hypothetical protein LBJ00_04270 [Planctomycetaceae bacterium]|nr:hypothetical protein [Planctomycetaceae bacterium]
MHSLFLQGAPSGSLYTWKHSYCTNETAQQDAGLQPAPNKLRTELFDVNNATLKVTRQQTIDKFNFVINIIPLFFYSLASNAVAVSQRMIPQPHPHIKYKFDL